MLSQVNVSMLALHVSKSQNTTVFYSVKLNLTKYLAVFRELKKPGIKGIILLFIALLNMLLS